MELVAFGKSDRPQGLFEMVLKFINFIIFDIQATPLLNQQHVYPAIMQLLVHIEYSLKNNMLKKWYEDCNLILDIEKTDVLIPEKINIHDISDILFNELNYSSKHEYIHQYLQALPH
jgi:hypothetical protein